MKQYKGKLMLTSLVILFPLVLGLILWPRLPEEIATHFTLAGEADGWSPKWVVVLVFPAVLELIHLFCIRMTLRDPRSGNVGGKVFAVLLWIIPSIAAIGMVGIYVRALGLVFNMAVPMLALLGLLFLLLGNYMAKAHQNSTVGIRLPWTLNSNENWNRTHRLSGKLFLVSGLLFWANIVFRTGWLVAAAVILSAVIPILYSYALHKKGI